ncbi:MAG TPA: DUF1080 domain-containing protein [Planctomycetota bacterium]|nr:DUF1080 domain-containing protein [Planctomycetota bacterium]
MLNSLSAEDKKPPAEVPAKTEWKVLCDGKSLKDWKVTPFGGEGAVKSEDGAIVMQRGTELTGINWDGAALPKQNYEVELEAKRIDGSDFFCGLVFTVGDSQCSFVAGGWGGGTVGLSAVDGMYADDNATTTIQAFDDNRWYKIRLRVSENHIQAWIDNKRVVNLATAGKQISVHPAVAQLKPLGVSCYSSIAAVKNIRIRDLTKEESVEVPKE